MAERISNYTNKGILSFNIETGELNLENSVINPDIIDIPMVYVEGGKFKSKGNKRVVDIVAGDKKSFNVESFWHSQTCITNKQFMIYARDQNLEFNFNNDNYPVTNVSWIDAAKFCNWLSEKHNIEPCYVISEDEVIINDTEGFKIPTIEQWIWVAQGGTAAYDSIFPGDDDPLEVGWFEENSNGEIKPVGQLKPVLIDGDPLKPIYDLVGLVWKMTSTPVEN